MRTATPPMPDTRRRNRAARGIWWLLFLPRLLAALITFLLVWLAFGGNNINAWQSLVCLTAAWWVSPARLWPIALRHRRRRRLQAVWQQPRQWQPPPQTWPPAPWHQPAA